MYDVSVYLRFAVRSPFIEGNLEKYYFENVSRNWWRRSFVVCRQFFTSSNQTNTFPFNLYVCSLCAGGWIEVSVRTCISKMWNMKYVQLIECTFRLSDTYRVHTGLAPMSSTDDNFFAPASNYTQIISTPIIKCTQNKLLFKYFIQLFMQFCLVSYIHLISPAVPCVCNTYNLHYICIRNFYCWNDSKSL